MSVFNQSIGQNRASQRIVLIQLVGFAQQLDSVGGFLLREQILAFGHQAMGFGLALHAVLRELLQFAQFRVVGEFCHGALQQIQGAGVVAGMQTGIDLFDQARFGFDASLLVAPFLQTFHFKRQPGILAVDGAQDFPVVQRIAVRALLFVKVGARDDGVDQIALILHQPQRAFKVRFSGMKIESLAQNVHALVEIRFRLDLAIDRRDKG